MEHFSDVLKIIEGGLKFNAQTVVNYARALKARLESDGEHQQARLLQSKLDFSAQTLAAFGSTTAPQVPVDQESQLDLANLEVLLPASTRAILEGPIRADVDRFLSYGRAADKLIEAGVGVAPRMLIYGPPGVGKTQLARHVAAELGLPLLTARCDSLISSFLGSTAKNIRRLFDHASERPCVLFLDEFDALAKARDDAQELGELKRVVVGLLQNIDAMPPSSVLIAATNHQQLLDPAVWRRFAFRVHIDLPNHDLRAALLNAYLDKFKPKDHLEWVVSLSEGFSGATLREVAEDCIRGAVISGRDTVASEELIHRTVQTALVAQNLSPTESAIARFLLERGVPQRLVSSASNMSMRQVLKLAADINRTGQKDPERTPRKTRVAKKEIGRGRKVQKPSDSGRAPSKGAKAKTSRRR